MIRKALIIGGYDPKANCGIDVDLKNYKNFLTNPSGGAWYDHEIEILDSPNQYSLQNATDRVRGADFSLIVFSGHGGFETDTRRLMLEFGKDYDDSYGVLCRLTDKQILITDCCREHYSARGLIAESAIAMDAFTKRVQPDFFRCRYIYEYAIEKAPKDQVTMLSCQDGEVSRGSDTTGGLYSKHLIETSLNWASCNSNKYLTIEGAHDKVKQALVCDPEANQTPELRKPRTHDQLPFAVTD